MLNAGGGVDMHRWVDMVPAILHIFYPGQEGGVALAQILFGDHNSSGKLPITIDRTWEDSPVHDSYYPKEDETRAPSPEGLYIYGVGGVNHTAKIEQGVTYKEGLLNGYRYYSGLTKNGSTKKSLFPFGFGLSYTTFSFSNLHIGAVSENGVERHRQRHQYRKAPRRRGRRTLSRIAFDPRAHAGTRTEGLPKSQPISR